MRKKTRQKRMGRVMLGLLDKEIDLDYYSNSDSDYNHQKKMYKQRKNITQIIM